jgi:hypothetical protein
LSTGCWPGDRLCQTCSSQASGPGDSSLQSAWCPRQTVDLSTLHTSRGERLAQFDGEVCVEVVVVERGEEIFTPCAGFRGSALKGTPALAS